jgi:hypothetical protein
VPVLPQLICDAIASRRLLMFAYGDVVRVVEPHLFGVNSAGHESLSAWLRAGHSRADPEGWWRTYLLDGMRDVQLLDETFTGPREGYNPDDERMARIVCRLERGGQADDAGNAPADGPPPLRLVPRDGP